MHFIPRSAIPQGRIWSYYNPQIQVKVKDGEIKYRARGTYGGDKGDYEGDNTAWAADLTTIKLLLNAVVSEDADFMCADIKDFYLGTTLTPNKHVTQRRSKDIVMRYHWVQDRVQQKHFIINWKPGRNNLADYFTKAHPVHHVKSISEGYYLDKQIGPSIKVVPKDSTK